MTSATGYILRTRPYTEANVIVDLLTVEQGRLTCMARPAKVRGKVQRGHLQAFRLLQVEWRERGEMGRVTQTDERYHHRIPAAHLLYGIYLNELLLRCLKSHTTLDGLFDYYQRCLTLLVDTEAPMVVVMRFELFVFEGLGHSIDLWQCESNGHAINSAEHYIYQIGLGTSLHTGYSSFGDIPIAGELLIALRAPIVMNIAQYQALRVFLDQLWLKVLGKALNSRKLLAF